jgi:hypothetical protein
MSEGAEADAAAAERQPYWAPALTRHGSLDELTRGSGTKQTEKFSDPN